jgi:cell division protein FtsZ
MSNEPWQPATRIREEVDADANIIVGATFDESLDGIIRVSVVATGLDIDAPDNVHTAPPSHAPASPQTRGAAQMPSTMQAPGANLAADAKADVHEACIAELAQQLRADNERIAERADAYPPPSAPGAAESKVFIPPPPAQPATRAERMPSIKDFPPSEQNSVQAKRGELLEEDPLEKRRLTLLQRLAAVGLGRREDQPNQEQVPKVRAPERAKR